jgi:hypothetical protein
MEAPGTNLNMIAPLNNLTSESHNSTYTNLMEKVSHQTMNRSLNPQMKSQPNLDLNQKVPAKNSRNDMHLQLKQQLQHQEHQEPSMLTTGENPESYRSQTRTALASLLLAKNNNRPQQIWRLRLLQLQQQRLHSFLVSYHHHLFLMMASPAPATRKLSPPVFSLPNKISLFCLPFAPWHWVSTVCLCFSLRFWMMMGLAPMGLGLSSPLRRRPVDPAVLGASPAPPVPPLLLSLPFPLLSL